MTDRKRSVLAIMGFADPDKQDELHGLICRYIGGPAIVRLISVCCRSEIDDFRGEMIRLSKSSKALVQSDKTLQKVILEQLQDAVANFSSKNLPLEAPLSLGYADWEGGKQMPAPIKFSSKRPTSEVVISGKVSLHTPVHKLKNYFAEQANAAHNIIQTVGFIDVEIQVQARVASTGCSVEFTLGTDPKIVEEGFYKSLATKSDWGITCKDMENLRLAIEVKVRRVPIEQIIAEIKLLREYRKFYRWVVVAPWQLKQDELEAFQREDILFVGLGKDFDEYRLSYSKMPDVSIMTV